MVTIMAGGPGIKSKNTHHYEESLLTIYKTENSNIEDFIQSEIYKNDIPLKLQKSHQSAVIGELAGLATEVIDLLTGPLVMSIVNLSGLMAIGFKLTSFIKKANANNQKVKVSEKGIGYIATYLNEDKLVNNQDFVEFIGPYSISNPNSTLSELTNIHISGLDKIFGVLVALKFKEGIETFRIEWQIYNNCGQLVLSWTTYDYMRTTTD